MALFFCSKSIERGWKILCLMNNQPVNEYCSPCGKCPDYLNSCMPIVINGYIFGECDLVACEFCDFEEECLERK